MKDTAPRAGFRWTGVALILFGLAIGIEATTFDVAFLTDPIGPKALPWLVAAILIGAGLHAVVGPTWGSGSPVSSEPPVIDPSAVRRPKRAIPARVAAATAAFLLYALALPWMGFFLSTSLVMGALSGLFGAPPFKAAAAAASLSAALWLLFVYGLSLPLPLGDLWIR